MDKIVEKDIGDLKKKNKKFKFSLKKTIIGLLLVGMTISFVPNLEYFVALQEAKNSTYIETVMQQPISIEEKIATIFADGINKNNGIDSEMKELIISSFKEHVINEFGSYFTEDTIANMYAVAMTENVTMMSEFAIEHGWWSGDYNPYTNTYSIETTEETLVAHEQLHAILKSGFFGSGLAKGLKGYGANEGLTTFAVKDDDSYAEEDIITNMLGLILGFDKVIPYYLNRDLDGFIQELSQYISEKEANELIRLIDKKVFVSYLETFLEKNKIPYDKESMHERNFQWTLRIQELLKELFESKYNTQIQNSNFGRVLFGKCSNYFDNEWKVDEPIYIIQYYNETQVKLSIVIFNLSGNYDNTYIIDTNDLPDLNIDVLLEEAVKEFEGQTFKRK